MFRERRIRKQPVNYTFSNPDSPKKKLLEKKKTAFIKGSYQLIPFPTKFSYSNQTYSLYGNIVLMERNGSLIMEPSLLNNFLNYRDVQVSKIGNQKIVTVHTEKRRSSNSSDWKSLVDKLMSHQDAKYNTLGSTISRFCSDYEEIINKNAENENQNTMEIEQKDSVNEENELLDKKKNKLMESHPSICITSRLKRQNDDITEISVNQKFLSEIGYTPDSFASTVLQEGIPQLFSWQSEASSSLVNVIIENYFNNKQEGFQTSEFEAPLLLKSGYVKNIKFRVHLLCKKEKDGFIMDTIFTIFSKNTPFFQETSLAQYLNSDFLNLMNFKEKEMETFLSIFYQESPALRYTNMDKVCRVQEITSDDDDE